MVNHLTKLCSLCNSWLQDGRNNLRVYTHTFCYVFPELSLRRLRHLSILTPLVTFLHHADCLSELLCSGKHFNTKLKVPSCSQQKSHFVFKCSPKQSIFESSHRLLLKVGRLYMLRYVQVCERPAQKKVPKISRYQGTRFLFKSHCMKDVSTKIHHLASSYNPSKWHYTSS